MIEFKGEPSRVCKDYLCKRFRIREWLMMKPITLCIFVVPTICFAVAFEESRLIFCLIAILMSIFLLSIPWTFGYKKSIDHSIPILLDIQGEKMEITSASGYMEINIFEVKKIVDFGEGYAFTFYFPNLKITVICQKDLLVEGTIEEFEKLFEGKIVRKNKTINAALDFGLPALVKSGDMMYIKTMSAYDKYSKEADVVVSDGKHDLLCHCDYAEEVTIGGTIKSIDAFMATDIMREEEVGCAVQKISDYYAYRLVGRVIDINSPTVQIGKLKILLDSALPADIKVGEYIEFKVIRLDVDV